MRTLSPLSLSMIFVCTQCQQMPTVSIPSLSQSPPPSPLNSPDPKAQIFRALGFKLAVLHYAFSDTSSWNQTYMLC